MSSVALSFALAAAVVGAVTDLHSRRIPNLLTLVTLTGGLLLHAATGGPTGLGLSLLGVLAVGVPATVLFALRAMGGGDVKLLAGCGALLGPAAGLQLLLATAVAGGILAVGMVFANRALAVTGHNLLRLFGHWRRRGLTPCPAVSLGATRGVTLPYGVAIACGMLFTFASRLGGA
ncbi:MAG: prepilin peptidase [Gemmatimonadota bacterium]